jgi:hypothetical protein
MTEGMRKEAGVSCAFGHLVPARHDPAARTIRLGAEKTQSLRGDGGLPLNSFRTGDMPATDESGQKQKCLHRGLPQTARRLFEVRPPLKRFGIQRT